MVPQGLKKKMRTTGGERVGGKPSIRKLTAEEHRELKRTLTLDDKQAER